MPRYLHDGATGEAQPSEGLTPLRDEIAADPQLTVLATSAEEFEPAWWRAAP